MFTELGIWLRDCEQHWRKRALNGPLTEDDVVHIFDAIQSEVQHIERQLWQARVVDQKSAQT